MKIDIRKVKKTHPFTQAFDYYYEFSVDGTPIFFLSTSLFEQGELEIVAGLEKLANHIEKLPTLPYPFNDKQLEHKKNETSKEIWVVSIPCSKNYKGLPLKDFRAFDDYDLAQRFIETNMGAELHLSKIDLYEKKNL